MSFSPFHAARFHRLARHTMILADPASFVFFTQSNDKAAA